MEELKKIRKKLWDLLAKAELDKAVGGIGMCLSITTQLCGVEHSIHQYEKEATTKETVDPSHSR